MYDWYIMILWQPNFIPLRPVLAYDTTWNGVSADGILGRVCVGMGEAVRVCPEIKGGCCLRDCMEGGQCVDNIVRPQLGMTWSGPVEAQWGYHPLTTQRGFLFCVFVIWRSLWQMRPSGILAKEGSGQPTMHDNSLVWPRDVSHLGATWTSHTTMPDQPQCQVPPTSLVTLCRHTLSISPHPTHTSVW